MYIIDLLFDNLITGLVSVDIFISTIRADDDTSNTSNFSSFRNIVLIVVVVITGTYALIVFCNWWILPRCFPSMYVGSDRGQQQQRQSLLSRGNREDSITSSLTVSIALSSVSSPKSGQSESPLHDNI
jgi:hypothetical protein